MKRTIGVAAAAAAIALSLSACGGPAPASTEAKGEINYWLWDSNQLPGYQQCADDFTKANPDIKVKVTQRGWDDYWTTLTNGFVAGTAPDVFTDHLAKYPEFASKKQLLSLDDAVKTDKIDLGIYNEGLADLWVGQDG
jgi:multiple sugar transport system substrate-binding protein